jgi:hypothetical protein
MLRNGPPYRRTDLFGLARNALGYLRFTAFRGATLWPSYVELVGAHPCLGDAFDIKSVSLKLPKVSHHVEPVRLRVRFETFTSANIFGTKDNIARRKYSWFCEARLLQSRICERSRPWRESRFLLHPIVPWFR